MYGRINKLRAFTLIEVLVVVAIIGIASTVILVSFAGKRQSRNIERGAGEVLASLREAQNYALSGRAGSISENNVYYGVNFTADSPAYSVVSSNGTIGSYSLKNGVQFSESVSARFMIPRGDVYINGAVLTGSYSIALTGAAPSRYICVYSTGRIIDNGTASTCP